MLPKGSLLSLASMALLCLLAAGLPALAEKSKKDRENPSGGDRTKGPSQADRAASDALFDGMIPVIHIRIGEKELEKLRREPREYVEATLQQPGGPAVEKVGLKLKGSAGSFQPIDQRPGFSLNLDKFGKKKVFHGLSRFQLNNCNQDPTALHELVAGRIARAAGVPASRCTHALVSLNGRSLGIYVLKEPFREELLGAFFPRTDGRLYDGGFCTEIRKEMELDYGPDDKSQKLGDLVAALADTTPDRQLQRVRDLVDTDAYLRYLALENILTHWDGYSFNRNNYRLYENPASSRFHFLLHGMDQTLTHTDWDIWRAPQAAVGSILWRDPALQARYDSLLREICEKTLRTTDWPQFTEQAGNRQGLPAPDRRRRATSARTTRLRLPPDRGRQSRPPLRPHETRPAREKGLDPAAPKRTGRFPPARQPRLPPDPCRCQRRRILAPSHPASKGRVPV